MIKAYIFDFFGTLAFYDKSESVKDIVGQEMNDFLFTHKLSDTNISEEKKNKIKEICETWEIGLYKDSEEVVTKLKKKFKIALLSNTYDVTSMRLKKEFKNFFDIFDVVVFSSDMGIEKPNPEMFNHILKKLEVKPEETVMVGDNPKRDIAPASELGMSTILIDRSKQNLGELI